MKNLVILNLRSGRRKRRGQLPERIRETLLGLGIDADVRETESPDDVAPLVDEARSSGIGTIVAVGGDGTVSFVGRQLIGADLALAIVPTGSGNGLARHLGIPLDLAGALRVVATGEIRAIDTGIVDETPFLVTCGLGLDAEIAHRFAASTSRGLRTYLAEGARAWFSYERQNVEITVDGKPTIERPILVTLANASQYGNGARVAPSASVEDGVLDLVVLRHASLATAPALLWRLFVGRSFDRSPWVRSLRGREIAIRRKAPGPIHIDGEPAMAGEEIQVSVRPASLKILVPAGTKSV